MGKELKSFVGKTGRYLNNVKSAINSSFPVSFHCLRRLSPLLAKLVDTSIT
ncbi:unknown protein [Microcystis aeruginosa NIES-843]|uniref:Uncharacterized protein n=1 Tax=Microcystis aeruginosa (strain NIES-843 / IAM M-2473) TaxID=449447 RepID=B0JQY3_MICAN|nr:unknown protein [Microcystis aeruginosa NIES-843]